MVLDRGERSISGGLELTELEHPLVIEVELVPLVIVSHRFAHSNVSRARSRPCNCGRFLSHNLLNVTDSRTKAITKVRKIRLTLMTSSFHCSNSLTVS